MSTAVEENALSEGLKKKKKKGKGQRVSVADQYTNLQAACRNVKDHLLRKGVDLDKYDADIVMSGDGQRDLKTNAMVVTALAPVVFLLTRFSGLWNWFQRRTFNHTRDPIYQRLIVAILEGYYVPPLRVAAVTTNNTDVVHDPRKAEDWTLIDGLQRTTCYIIAVLLAVLGEELVDMGCLDETIWEETFKDHAEACDVETLLTHKQQLEVFYEINTAGVLHFMLLLNAAQRQMNAKIQLELMSIPLLQMLQTSGISLIKEQEKATDNKLEKSRFKGANLIVGVQAYLQRNPHVSTSQEIDSFLGDEGGEYLQPPKEDMTDVINVLRMLTGPLHGAVQKHFDSTILSEGEVFTTAFMAAAGKFADMTSFGQLQEAVKRLISDIQTGRDPLDLDTYWDVYGGIKSGRGRKIRSIIQAAFLEYFRGQSKKLDWKENAAVYA